LRKIAILGSTGSIGTQAVEVAQRLSGSLSVEALSAHSNGELLLEQSSSLRPDNVCMSDPDAALTFRDRFADLGIDFFAGTAGLDDMLDRGSCELVLNALVGFAGLAPTLKVLEKGTTLALANKESLVAGGRLVMEASRENNALVLPVDSEHSAIFQCLAGQDRASLRRILLTASGGPFRDLPVEALGQVTVEDALAHPTWKMGPKVTIDSATLMNKGLEVLEAYHLFGVDLDQVEVVMHPESVIHSMVEMVDGSVLAQLGVPDMRIPIQYALTYPERAASPAGFLSLVEYGSLTFREIDRRRFPCVELAYLAGRAGKTYPAAMNAANEEAVAAFLTGRLRFTDIPAVIEGVLEEHVSLSDDSLEELVGADGQAREDARRIIGDLEVRA